MASTLRSVSSGQATTGLDAESNLNTSPGELMAQDSALTLEPTGSRKRKNEDDGEYQPASAPSNKRRRLKTKRNARANPSDQPTLPEKYEPHGQPIVWSEQRSPLNDALPYYKSHQSSLYTNGKVPYGLLVDAGVDIRDHFSSQVIITTAGGGRTRDDETGKMVRSEDQKAHLLPVSALVGSVGRRLVVIAGAKNRLIPVKMPHYYCVLERFWITDVWWELYPGKGEPVKQCMVRLEKVDLATRSWFAPKGSSPEQAGEFKVGEYTCEKLTCEACKQQSKDIYKDAWACLNPECAKFSHFNKDVDISELEYNVNFLRERTEYKGVFEKDEKKDLDIIPKSLKVGKGQFGCEKEFKAGVVCPRCGCCNSRRNWEGWSCSNPSCDWEKEMPIDEIPLSESERENEKLKATKPPHPSIVPLSFEHDNYRMTVYPMPGENFDEQPNHVGFAMHIQPRKEVLKRDGGVDGLYKATQALVMPLKRRGAKNTDGTREEVTSHFSVNYGAPYKFGVHVDSYPFHAAPGEIMNALTRLTWAGQKAVAMTEDILKGIKDKTTKDNTAEGVIPTEFEPFNEELVLGYFQDSKIGAHDDGEKELGPTVATLSLGSPSVMKFMPKKHKNIGDTKDIGTKVRATMLELNLLHGDMIVMHGAGIQKMYNHSVVSMGVHRFALTCRHIRKETIPDAARREQAEVDGKIPEVWDCIRYDGDRDRFELKKTGEATTPPS